MKEIKEVHRERIRLYTAQVSGAEYHEGCRGIWQVPCDIALPCATQNELDLDGAKALVANSCFAVGEGANMPTTLEATRNTCWQTACSSRPPKPPTQAV